MNNNVINMSDVIINKQIKQVTERATQRIKKAFVDSFLENFDMNLSSFNKLKEIIDYDPKLNEEIDLETVDVWDPSIENRVLTNFEYREKWYNRIKNLGIANELRYYHDYKNRTRGLKGLFHHLYSVEMNKPSIYIKNDEKSATIEIDFALIKEVYFKNKRFILNAINNILNEAEEKNESFDEFTKLILTDDEFIIYFSVVNEKSKYYAKKVHDDIVHIINTN